ncbi:MAG: hypothetical protein GX339_10665 [Tissierellia bacterium]|nr:hypothetical protein [Tissierellia bacterium]
MVSDRLGVEFIGTLEDDMIIYTIFDLEQFIGQEIHWVTGKTFDEIIDRGNGKKHLPNAISRFCTSEMKIQPLFDWWDKNFTEPVEVRIGYRANELRRVENMKKRLNKDGLLTHRKIIGKSKTRNKWGDIAWEKPVYPLIEDNIFKDNIEEYWRGKPVRFAYMNNCIGCFHRNEMLLKLMSEKFPEKFNWFVKQEGQGYKSRTFKNGITYAKIRQFPMAQTLDFEDFTDCDSGYCGI